MIKLTKTQIILMQNKLIDKTGGIKGIRDDGLLDSAINAPFQSFDGYDLFPSIEQKAAKLCVGLVMDHPFLDGNKRIGAHSMLVFLGKNGIKLDYNQNELVDIILRLASSNARDTDILRWILSHIS